MKLHGVLKELADTVAGDRTLASYDDDLYFDKSMHAAIINHQNRVATALRHLADQVGSTDLETLDEQTVIDTLRLARMTTTYSIEIQDITKPSAMGTYTKLGAWQRTPGVYDSPEHALTMIALTQPTDGDEPQTHYAYRLRLTDPLGNERWGAIFTRHDIPNVTTSYDLAVLDIYIHKMTTKA